MYYCSTALLRKSRVLEEDCFQLSWDQSQPTHQLIKGLSVTAQQNYQGNCCDFDGYKGDDTSDCAADVEGGLVGLYL